MREGDRPASPGALCVIGSTSRRRRRPRPRRDAAANTSFGLISRTGRFVVYTTLSAVLPSSARARAVPPWVLITMQSTSSLWAAARISAYGSPEGTRIRDLTDFPANRAANFSRYAFDRFTPSVNAIVSSACPASGAFPRGTGRLSGGEPLRRSHCNLLRRVNRPLRHRGAVQGQQDFLEHIRPPFAGNPFSGLTGRRDGGAGDGIDCRGAAKVEGFMDGRVMAHPPAKRRTAYSIQFCAVASTGIHAGPLFPLSAIARDRGIIVN